MGDLAAVRELCVQLDKTKDSLTRQLASVSAVDEQTQSKMSDILAERDLLKQQVMILNVHVQLLLLFTMTCRDVHVHVHVHVHVLYVHVHVYMILFLSL